MKKSDWKLLYNPFTRIAGWKAFFMGLPIVCLTVILGWLTGTMAYGLEVKAVGGFELWRGFYFTGTGIACTVAVMYLTGSIFSKGVRFQDILGTVTLARTPYLLSPLMGVFMNKDFMESFEAGIQAGDLGVIDWSGMALSGIFMISVSVWAVAMLYHAFRVSTDLKGPKCTLLFILSLLVSEIIMLVILW